jgi:hypothetical protein
MIAVQAPFAHQTARAITIAAASGERSARPKAIGTCAKDQFAAYVRVPQLQSLRLLCLLHVDPRHSIAGDQRPLRVRPKSAQDIPGRPMGSLSTMAMSMLLRRLDATITVHEFRSSFRDWAAETGVEFSVAEQCLAHAIGSNVTRSYLRTSMLERRRPVLASWAAFVTGEADSNVVPLRRPDHGHRPAP